MATILLLLASVVASSIVARLSHRKLPLPLVQIAIGAVLALAFGFRVTIDPELFLLLFITPLLFLDGWRIPKDGLFRYKWTIVALALGLVVVTVVGVGFFIHWMIPSMPLSVAFALAAVVSPTDAVALSAISAQAPVPARLMHILEGESLLNDASGLVCFRFAVIATLTGQFSIVDAATSFSWTAIAGIAIGAFVAAGANLTKDSVARRFGEETGSQILVSLLIPFGAYLAAVPLQASGILAAVSAGIVMHYEERSGRATAMTRIRRAAVWDAIQFAVNGAVFVVRGDQLPGIIANADAVAVQAGKSEAGWLAVYVVVITFLITALRGIWTWITLAAGSLRASTKPHRLGMPRWYVVGVASLAGVRGAVTLSAAMALPLTLEDGSAFPARDLTIALAAGIIVASLIAANIGLPVLARFSRQPPGHTACDDLAEMRLAAVQAALDAVRASVGTESGDDDAAGLRTEAAMRVIADYQRRIESHNKPAESIEVRHRIDAFEHALRIVALTAERDEYYRFARSGQLADEAIRALVREVDLMESKLREP